MNIQLGNNLNQSSFVAPKVERVIKQPYDKTNDVEKIKNSVEIVDFLKSSLGYRPTIQEKLILDSIDTINKKIMGPQKEFQFAIHKQTKQIMVKVIDTNTKEIIREIPAEKVLDAVAQMIEISGIFMDEKR